MRVGLACARGPRSARPETVARALAWALVLVFVFCLPGATPGASADETTSFPRAPERRERFGRGGRGEGAPMRALRREWMEGLARALPDSRPIERLAILRSARLLPVAERRALGARLRRFDSLAPPERSGLVAELEALRDRADAEVERMERNLDRWERMSDEERERYREQMRKLRAMPLEERERLLDEWERERAGRRKSGREHPPATAPEPAPALEDESR